MWKSIKTFLASEDGATAVEYCVMLAMILIAVIAGITATGGGTAQWWQNAVDDFTTYGV